MIGFPPRTPRTGRRQAASHNSTPLKALYVLRRIHTFSQRDGCMLERRIIHIKSRRTKELRASGNIRSRFLRSTDRPQWGNLSPILSHPTPPRGTGRRV